MQHKHCWQATVMNWLAIFSCDPSSATGTVPRRGRPDNFRWSPGAGGTGRAGPGRARGLYWASASSLKWFLHGGRWRTMWAEAAVPQRSRLLQRNQPAGPWIIPESSGSCRCGSHQWNQNLLFQMERQTMHNMSWCTLCDRLVPATNEAAGVGCRYRTAVTAARQCFNYLGI